MNETEKHLINFQTYDARLWLRKSYLRIQSEQKNWCFAASLGLAFKKNEKCWIKWMSVCVQIYLWMHVASLIIDRRLHLIWIHLCGIYNFSVIHALATQPDTSQIIRLCISTQWNFIYFIIVAVVTDDANSCKQNHISWIAAQRTKSNKFKLKWLICTGSMPYVRSKNWDFASGSHARLIMAFRIGSLAIRHLVQFVHAEIGARTWIGAQAHLMPRPRTFITDLIAIIIIAIINSQCNPKSSQQGSARARQRRRKATIQNIRFAIKWWKKEYGSRQMKEIKRVKKRISKSSTFYTKSVCLCDVWTQTN